MRVRLTQLDGKLPNLALMKLAHYYRSRGDEVYFSRSARRDIYEPDYDLVLGSQIFDFSRPKAAVFLENFPGAILRGTGTENLETAEQFIGLDEYEHYDYEDWPSFPHSIGFTQRGCRLKCPFCVVPKKEGKVRGVNSIYDIWRGPDHPKQVHLLDNDFFGQEGWKERAEEIIAGGFEVCFNQGINVRLIDGEGASYLARMKYRDDQFKRRRVYTAWDNRRDEAVFFRGIKTLTDAGIRPGNILVYMLCGYWPQEDFERDVYYRFKRMDEVGLLPFPMVYTSPDRPPDRTLKRFQRWVVGRYYKIVEWEKYDNRARQLSYRKDRQTGVLFT